MRITTTTFCLFVAGNLISIHSSLVLDMDRIDPETQKVCPSDGGVILGV